MVPCPSKIRCLDMSLFCRPLGCNQRRTCRWQRSWDSFLGHRLDRWVCRSEIRRVHLRNQFIVSPCRQEHKSKRHHDYHTVSYSLFLEASLKAHGYSMGCIHMIICTSASTSLTKFPQTLFLLLLKPLLRRMHSIIMTKTAGICSFFCSV